MSVDVDDLDLKNSHEKFIDKTTVIYGESGTGKSFLITNILYSLKQHIDQGIVFSPTDKQNHTYDKGLFPTPMIHYTMTEKILDDIWLRQEALAATNTRSNDIKLLKRLYKYIPTNARVNSDALLVNIDKKLQEYAKTVNNDEDKVAQMEEDCDELKIKVYKQLINANKDYLAGASLDADSEYCFKYHNTNPRLVLIFDDCTDLIKKYRNTSVMQKLFYQGRHARITALIACHTDKSLDAELKKNAAISVFTEKSCAFAYFDRPSTNLDKDAKQQAFAICKNVFSGAVPFQKLCWIRHEKKYYKFVASKIPSKFRFCSDIIWDFCEQIEPEAGKVSSNNPFIGSFK